MNIQKELFNAVDIWVHIENVPTHWMLKEVGCKIGKLFNQVNDVLILEFGSSRGIPIKILANVNLDKPLLRGTSIKLNGEMCWVDFKYEQLATFCYYCGRIGHSNWMCQIKREDLRK